MTKIRRYRVVICEPYCLKNCGWLPEHEGKNPDAGKHRATIAIREEVKDWMKSAYVRGKVKVERIEVERIETETDYWKKRYVVLLGEIEDRFGLLVVGGIEVDVSKRMLLQQGDNKKKDLWPEL